MIDRIRLQPLARLDDNAIFGYEALYRKKDAEAYPSASEILKSVTSLHSYKDNFRLFVNMTTKDLVDPSFCRSLLGTLEEKQIDGSNIVLEVSENTSPDLLPAAKRTLSLLRNYNIKIVLDDFGTEYSTMLFLNELPVDIVKIDKSFVQETPSSRRARSLLKFAVNISHDLGCEVVAEGIETQEQLDCVKDSGADIGQGFLFSAPFINFKHKMTPFIKLCEFASFPIESLQKAYCWRCN